MSISIVVVGLGYVGLPLAVALAEKFDVIGFDIDESRVRELQSGTDRTGEISNAKLSRTSLTTTSDSSVCGEREVYIVTVPTPVDQSNNPDLGALEKATRQVSRWIKPNSGAVIIYESTVYPGVTEDHCGAILEQEGLVRGRDFKLGYSPERINPGDRVHTVDKITKVIAAEDDQCLDLLERMYGSITSGGVFRAASIKAAEASKAIENAQRDINIAFVNEIAKISARVGLSIWDILDASRTKWNFLPFEPGLVGGHCIGVDPYYLSHLSEKLGMHPQVILAGRETNDGMGRWVADQLHRVREGTTGSVLVLGVTFKENVPDIRNSRIIDVADRLEELGHSVTFADPQADAREVASVLGRPLTKPSGDDRYDLLLGAVPHDEYRAMSCDQIAGLVNDGGTIADLKGMWREHRPALGDKYWSL